jgi:uncharacterized protein (DUF433 family)
MSILIQNLSDLLGASQHTFIGGEPNLLQELIRSKESGVDDFARQAGSNLRFLQKKLSLVPKPIADAVQIDPSIMHGTPVFKGTRIPIHQIVEELADGTSFEQLAQGYPSLDSEKIRLGLDFVASLLRINDE